MSITKGIFLILFAGVCWIGYNRYVDYQRVEYYQNEQKKLCNFARNDLSCDELLKKK
jgi:hypothetical protein